jgi:hypothetical protein
MTSCHALQTLPPPGPCHKFLCTADQSNHPSGIPPAVVSARQAPLQPPAEPPCWLQPNLPSPRHHGGCGSGPARVPSSPWVPGHPLLCLHGSPSPGTLEGVDHAFHPEADSSVRFMKKGVCNAEEKLMGDAISNRAIESSTISLAVHKEKHTLHRPNRRRMIKQLIITSDIF